MYMQEKIDDATLEEALRRAMREAGYKTVILPDGTEEAL